MSARVRARADGAAAADGAEVAGAAVGRARGWLALVWGGGFGASLCGAAGLYLIDYVEADTFQALASQLSATYAVYVGIIAGFVFSGPPAPTGHRPHARTAFWLAMGPSLLWNALVLALVGRVYGQWGSVEGAVEDIAFLGSTLSWIVAPGLGFYFARHELQ